MLYFDDGKFFSYEMIGEFRSSGEWSHPLRTINSYEFILVKTGTLYLKEDITEYELNSGDMIILEPGKIHGGYRTSTEKISFYWLHFCTNLSIPFKALSRGDIYDIRHLIKKLLNATNGGYCSNHTADTLAFLIFDELSKNKINCNFYDRDLPLFKCYSLEKHLMSGINKKVWLNSGAYLIIEPTEALTVIDVNTGKAELKSNKEETFYKINIEAAHEVARQLKIRNISGIIIVDFISMRNKENEQMLLNKMNEILKYDYSRCIAVDITKLGLMEITRKKGKKSLYEIIQK